MRVVSGRVGVRRQRRHHEDGAQRRGHQAARRRRSRRHGRCGRHRLVQEEEETALVRDQPVRQEATPESLAQEAKANYRRIRDPSGPAGRSAGGDARQAQHLVPRVRSQAARGRGPQPALHDHGGVGKRSRATVRCGRGAGAAAAAGRPVAVRAAAAHHRRHPHARREDDPGPAARLHPAHAQVLHGARQAGLGARVDAAAVVAQGPAVGQRAHGRALRGRETEDVVDARAAADRDQLLQVPRPRGPAARLHGGRRPETHATHVTIRASGATDHHQPGRVRVARADRPLAPHHHAAGRHHGASDPQRRRRQWSCTNAGRRVGDRGPERGGRGHAQPRRTDHTHRRGRPRVPGVGVGRDHGAGVGLRVPVHGGLHAAAGRRLRGAAHAGGAKRRRAGGARHERRRGAGDAAGRRHAGAAGAQPQGRHRAHQGHATSESGAGRGGGGLLAADPGGARLRARAGGARVAPPAPAPPATRVVRQAGARPGGPRGPQLEFT